jgi:glycosyltransferase involved in cell wall biosynthesis
MRFLVLYPYPRSIDSLSLQGHYLVKGLKELGHEVISCDRSNDNEKKKIYETFHPDVVIGIGCWKNLPETVLHPNSFNIPAVGWFNANGWVANYHEELNSLPLILATSNWVKSTYLRDGVKEDNIHVCHVGYDPEIFFPKSQPSIRKKLGIKEDEVILFTVGGDVTSKGAQEMFKALAKVDRQFRDWKYILKTLPTFSAYDHGKNELKLIESLGLDKNKIIYIRDDLFPDKMAELMQACDIYAAPSRLEGFGMTQVEAQACAKPVISINVGGPRDTIIHGKTGFLADVAYELKLSKELATKAMGFVEEKFIEFPIPKTFEYHANIDQLADFTLNLCLDKELRKQIGENAAKHALDKFHYKTTAKRMVDLIEEFVLKK